jgi:hypothetical protein
MKDSQPTLSELAIQEAAAVLVEATCEFLRRNRISKTMIMKSVRRARRSHGGVRQYRKLVRAYEDMGMVMSTWYSQPRFLDSEGRPLPLTAGRGILSISNLIRLSRVKISVALALELLRQSPSVQIDALGRFIAVKRMFVLPDFEVPRAALVIERYLDTLRKNYSAQKNGASLLLERNCHVPEIDVRRISPILRDIKERGTAFMDSVDGDIEAFRTQRSSQRVVGELGVLIFAWTRPSTPRRSKASLVNQLVARTGMAARRSIPKARAR